MPRKPASPASRKRSSSGAPPTSKPSSPPAAGAAIRIRMYRIGFGDCFLTSFPCADRTRYMLVDFGVHAKGDIHTSDKIMDDVAAVTGKRLDIVIGTHAHQDHLSGFAKYADRLRGFSVGQVWLPWTEDPHDPQAAKYKAKQLALTEQVDMHLTALAAAGEVPSEERLAAMNAILNLAGNEKALSLLKDGINGGAVRYFEAGKEIPDTGIAGLAARALGPPRDEKFLSRMDPPSGERWKKKLDDGSIVDVNVLVPFDDRWIDRPTPAPLSAVEADDIERLCADAEGLAFALDHAVNNCSLVVHLTFKGRHLLFPGDAQYGNWAAWIDAPAGKEILSQVSFLKVAHHGSHNATPKSALASMTQHGFAAMVSTQNAPWKSIPLPDLMTNLAARATAVVRSDSIEIAGAPKGPPLGTLPPAFSEGPFWIDYAIAV